MRPWSGQETDRLREMVREGLSATEIARKLDRERNSILGKIHRAKGGLGTLARSRPAGTPRNPQPSRAKAIPKARPAPPAPRPPALPRSLPVRREATPHHEASLPATLPVSFVEAVDRGRCLHFVGDPLGPDGPEMPVCGAERTAAHKRYCLRHARSSVVARVQP